GAAPVLWDEPGFRIAFKLYVVNAVVAWGISLIQGTLNNAAIGTPLALALFGALWYWARKAWASWPKWCLLVGVSVGALSGLVWTFTQSPLRLIPGALCLAALVVMLRRWPQRAVHATNPARWMPDPSGRHELRYWDGTAWTEHVSNSGALG